MNFAYQGRDISGRCLPGITEAADIIQAIENLRSRGVIVHKIEPAAEAPRQHGRRSKRPGRRLRNLALFTRQLSVLVRTGTPMAEALRATERQCKDESWRAVVAGLRSGVERGKSLSEAIGQYPECFDGVCQSLIAAGENGAPMDAMLDRLAQLCRKQLQLRNAVVGATTYPALLLAVAGSALLLMFLFVLPRFAGLFQSMNVPLPPTTRWMLEFSAFVRNGWLLLLACIVGAVIGFRLWSFTTAGRDRVHRALLNLPLVGRLVRSIETARIVRLIGVLVAGKTPMLQALELTKSATWNVHYARLLAAAANSLAAGESFSATLAESSLIEPSVVEAIRSGEGGGELASILLGMADFLDEENEVAVRSLTSILEPAILVVMGVIVGLTALSMFLPLFDMTSMTQRGGG